MKSSKACASLLAIFALAGGAFGRDSWSSKPSSEWNEKEVRQILENSPWAHRVRLMLVSPDGEKNPCMARNRRCNPEGDPAIPSSYPGPHRQTTLADVQSQQDRSSDSAASASYSGVAAWAIVRWASSRTVREALIRDGIQRGTMKSEEVFASPDSAPNDAYVVYVDLRVALADVKKIPQNGLFTQLMAQNAVLVNKSTGERLTPVRVRKAPLPEFDRQKQLALGSYYVIYPRQIDGKSAFPDPGVTLRFECPTGSVPIAAEFDLRKMSRGGSPDF